MTYEVRVHPGCGSTRTVSEHVSLADALRAARRSDRLQVTTPDGRPVWQAPERGSSYGGSGRCGRGPLRGEPSLTQTLREVESRIHADEVTR